MTFAGRTQIKLCEEDLPCPGRRAVLGSELSLVGYVVCYVQGGPPFFIELWWTALEDVDLRISAHLWQCSTRLWRRCIHMCFAPKGLPQCVALSLGLVVSQMCVWVKFVTDAQDCTSMCSELIEYLPEQIFPIIAWVVSPLHEVSRRRPIPDFRQAVPLPL